MVQVEMNNMYINIGANNGGEKTLYPSPESVRQVQLSTAS